MNRGYELDSLRGLEGVGILIDLSGMTGTEGFKDEPEKFARLKRDAFFLVEKQLNEANVPVLPVMEEIILAKEGGLLVIEFGFYIREGSDFAAFSINAFLFQSVQIQRMEKPTQAATWRQTSIGSCVKAEFTTQLTGALSLMVSEFIRDFVVAKYKS